MRKILLTGLAGAIGFVVVARLNAEDKKVKFQPDTLVVTRSVYMGTVDLITPGQTLPLGCAGGPNGSTTVDVPLIAGGTTPVTVTCGIASDNGEFPNLNDSHNVWNNANTDGSFGITSPIFLDNLSPKGDLLGTLAVPSNLIVTSFSSKSELALNLSVDGNSLTFVGYQGGQGCGPNGASPSPTAPNLIDASASNSPGVCDPTNPVISSDPSNPSVPTAYYRAVAEVDAQGNITVTPGNAYSGDNGRAAKKGSNDLYYMAGNDNSGNLSKKQLSTTIPGVELINATGAELLTPLQAPPVPPNIGMIGRLTPLGSDKRGKETNFRGLTIFDNTLYVSKGSGGNGVNSIYQAGSAGVLPVGTAADLASVPLTTLPGFPPFSIPESTSTFPFGMWFANSSTLYVCDEGDGVLVPNQTINGQTNVADAYSLANAGVQKWVLQSDTWVRLYVLQNGLNIGVPYSVPNYPASLNPATGGCRNMTGQAGPDGTVTIWAITSTLSTNGDQGADPNQLVRVKDTLSATTLPTPHGNPNGKGNDGIGMFETIRSATAGEVLRGVALAPGSRQ
jgi:hypothetical protein